MTAVKITFIGGEEAGDVGRTEWKNTGTGQTIVFPLNQPVPVDPDSAENAPQRDFMLHVIKKAKTNPFFKVEGQRGRPKKLDKEADDADEDES